MKCITCKGRGGGYETCYGYWPHITYEYVEIGDCEECNGTGEVEDIPEFEEDAFCMNDSEDYELYDSNFDEWLRIGRESFGIEDHPGEREDAA